MSTRPEVKTSEADSKPSALTDAECASQPTAILSIASDPLTAIPRIAIFLALSILGSPGSPRQSRQQSLYRMVGRWNVN
jgi:hypothetical protein